MNIKFHSRQKGNTCSQGRWSLTRMKKAYRRLHIIICSARFPDPALTPRKLLSRLLWNLVWRILLLVCTNSSRRFFNFCPWPKLWDPSGAPPGAKKWRKFFSRFFSIYVYDDLPWCFFFMRNRFKMMGIQNYLDFEVCKARTSNFSSIFSSFHSSRVLQSSKVSFKTNWMESGYWKVDQNSRMRNGGQIDERDCTILEKKSLAMLTLEKQLQNMQL